MIQIREIEIGSGKPKICVPITGRTIEDILAQARHIASLNVEMIEWRADYAEFLTSETLAKENILLILTELRNIIGNKILLFTFRTQKEGGEREISEADYMEFNLFAASTKLIDLVDVEVFFSETNLEMHIEALHNEGCKVILSNHDFCKTPEEDILVQRLYKMEQAGADIVKIAVMPRVPKDVVTLLSATCRANEKLTKPVVTISMGKIGSISRFAGQIFGSAITFGTAGEVSAPGQIPVAQLREFLDFFP